MTDNEQTVNIYPLLTFTVSFIDAMVKRGAINGDEMLQIGQIRQEMAFLIKTIEAQTAQAELASPSKDEPKPKE